MASILDAGLISVFSGVVIFLLVLVLVWGVLRYKKPWGENDGVYAIIALAVALFSAMAAPVRDFITFIAPWYVALAIVFFFALFTFTLFGIGEKEFSAAAKDPLLRNWIVILVLLIFVAGLGFTLGPALTAAGSGTPPPSNNGQQPIGVGSQYQDPGTIAPGGQVYSGPTAGQPGSTNTGDFGTNLLNTIVHPKVLGIGIVFLIAAFAIYFLSQGSS